MRQVVRIVKRVEREGANNSRVSDSLRTFEQSTPEIAGIVKSWIREFHERRRDELANHLRDFKRWSGETVSAGVAVISDGGDTDR